MANKLAKKYIKAAAKTVPSSQWKARGLKKAWALQKRAQKGGGKAKPAAKPKGKPRAKSNPKGGNVSSNKSPKIGASIQAFKGAQAVFAPAIDAVAKRPVTIQAGITDLRSRNPVNYGVSLLGEGINQAIDRKLAHASALSGGSATAWAAEIALGAMLYEKAQASGDAIEAVRGMNRRMGAAVRAYDVEAGKLALSNKFFRTYQGIKVGGGIVRRVSNMGPFKKIFAPAKKLLSSFGGRL